MPFACSDLLEILHPAKMFSDLSGYVVNLGRINTRNRLANSFGKLGSNAFGGVSKTSHFHDIPACFINEMPQVRVSIGTFVPSATAMRPQRE